MNLTPEKLLLLGGHEGERDVETICRESDLSTTRSAARSGPSA
jgi:hypothetical protein